MELNDAIRLLATIYCLGNAIGEIFTLGWGDVYLPNEREEMVKDFIKHSVLTYFFMVI